MKEYITLLSEQCRNCTAENPKCTLMQCRSIGVCFEAFYPKKKEKEEITFKISNKVGRSIQNMFVRDIPVFDKGKLLCWIRADITPKEDSVMQLIRVTFEDKAIEVLYLFDMDYGIVLTHKVAQQIHNIVDEPDFYGEKIDEVGKGITLSGTRIPEDVFKKMQSSEDLDGEN